MSASVILEKESDFFLLTILDRFYFLYLGFIVFLGFYLETAFIFLFATQKFTFFFIRIIIACKSTYSFDHVDDRKRWGVQGKKIGFNKTFIVQFV